MNTFRLSSICILAISLLLPACGSKKNNAAPVKEGLSDKVTGNLGGTSWTFTSGIAHKTNTGYEITLAGMGEQISCSRTLPATAHLSFNASAQIGRYEFDLSNPGSGSSPVFIIFPDNGNTTTITSRRSVVEMRSIDSGRITGGVYAESSESGSRGGSVSGNFEATICSNGGNDEVSKPVPIETGMKQLRKIEGNWIGNGTTSISDGPLSGGEVRFSLTLREEGLNTVAVLQASNWAQTEVYWQQELFVSNRTGFEQLCLPRGMAQPIVAQAGIFEPSKRAFRIQLKQADCSESRNTFFFQHDADGTLRITGTYYGLDRTRPLSKTTVDVSGMIRY